MRFLRPASCRLWSACSSSAVSQLQRAGRTLGSCIQQRVHRLSMCFPLCLQTTALSSCCTPSSAAPSLSPPPPWCARGGWARLRLLLPPCWLGYPTGLLHSRVIWRLTLYPPTQPTCVLPGRDALLRRRLPHVGAVHAADVCAVSGGSTIAQSPREHSQALQTGHSLPPWRCTSGQHKGEKQGATKGGNKGGQVDLLKRNTSRAPTPPQVADAQGGAEQHVPYAAGQRRVHAGVLRLPQRVGPQ